MEKVGKDGLYLKCRLEGTLGFTDEMKGSASYSNSESPLRTVVNLILVCYNNWRQFGRYAKLGGKPSQYQAIDEAIRTVQFVRNKCLRYWQENQSVGQKDL